MARQADEDARDNDVGHYGPGSEEWSSYRQLITFKQWLIQMRGAE